MSFQVCEKKIVQNFNEPDVWLRKTKNVHISFAGLYANNLQNLCNSFPYVIGFPKSKKNIKSDNWKWDKTKI